MCRSEEPHELDNLTGDRSHNDNEEESIGVWQKASDVSKCNEQNGMTTIAKERPFCKLKWHVVIEKASLVLIPLSFVAFNVWYWIISLSSLEA